MDMWKAFRIPLIRMLPRQGLSLINSMSCVTLSDALDEIRRQDYRRKHEKERNISRGQRYTLLSHKANLDSEGAAFFNAIA